jgi:hypothetical protein
MRVRLDVDVGLPWETIERPPLLLVARGRSRGPIDRYLKPGRHLEPSRLVQQPNASISNVV